MKVDSTFAILDVKDGREDLNKVIAKVGFKPIPVTITGFIVGEWSAFDGASQEFQVEVTKVEIPR